MINLHKPLNICRASAGTGKTYTLAAYYVGLLLSGEDYRSILAITFTNKATAEMGERIMGYLYGIAQGKEGAFLLRARDFMIRNKQASDAELARRAEECFRAMLLDYDNVKIQTIDTFLQTLLSGLASVLGIGAGFKPELDIDHIIAVAVDQLLSTDLSEQDKSILEDFMRLKLEQADKWDLRKSLRELAKKLYDESAQKLDAEHQILFDATLIRRRREDLEHAWQTNPDRATLAQLLQRCDSDALKTRDREAYTRLKRSLEEPERMETKDLFRGKEDSKFPEIVQATELAKRLKTAYNTLQSTLCFSREMELMASLQAIIQRNLAEANCSLLAQTATKLSLALKTGDADFILEKAGIRYKHILIDEFQDTSRLQWSVIEQLVQDVLAGQGHTLLVVGDIKQSIYRWRNGDWHIMDDLGKGEDRYTPVNNAAFPALTRNYRSREQVVKFNLSLFKNLIDNYPIEEEKPLIQRIYDEGFSPEALNEFYQADKKPGGFVRFRAFPYSSPLRNNSVAMIMGMFDTMEELLQKGAHPSDLMVLVRWNKEAQTIVKMHANLEPDLYPFLTSTHFVSADSFVLEASQAVKLIIDALRLICTNNEVAAQYITMATERPGLIEQIRQSMNPKTPLYEAVSELVKLLCTDENGQYTGSETAYINCLLDKTRAFVSSYGSSIEDFLVYWEDTLRKKAIPASATQAIQIMTVHSSKGLQAQTIFVPLCTWVREGSNFPNVKDTVWCQIKDSLDDSKDFVPIEDGDIMLDSLYREEYLIEHKNMRVDNLNMLYVAFTRAEDNLYISSDFSVKSDGRLGACKHVGQYLLNYTKLNEQITSPDLPLTNHGALYAEYTVGNEPVIRAQQEEEENETEQAQFWCNSEQVRFIQSQEGAMYTEYGDEAYRRAAKIDEGSLCHEIFANIHKADELDQVLDIFESNGSISNAAQRDKLKTLISSAWEGNEQMRDWFTAPWQLKLEESIYSDRRELRPDRVMINPETNEAIVLDYKFGQWNEHYITQVHDYMKALRDLGYSPVRGYLWFAHKPAGKQLIEVRP